MGRSVPDDLIREWMRQQGLGLRQIRKTRAGAESPDRDAQFRNIPSPIAISWMNRLFCRANQRLDAIRTN